MRPAVKDVDLGGLLATTVSEFQPVAASKGLKLRYVPVRCTVRTDGHLLVRVVRNYLSNAIRYTKSGSVLLGCRRVGGSVRVEVYDTGAGMPPNMLDEIFEEFRRLVGAADDYERGFGLGLAIVRRIARILDHPLSVRSVQGRGSCFGVSVPVVDWSALEASTRPSVGATGPNVLAGSVVVVIENEPAILEAMVTVLKKWGCEVMAGTSLAAARVQLDASDGEVSAIIADYHLDEDATGLDAITALREAVGRPVPGMVVTADRTAEVRKLIDAAGCVILNKPVRPGRLRSLLSHLVVTDDEGEDPSP
jgi:CheY-like chemotaxis protein